MRFAICNELFAGWALTDVLRFVAEVGYDGLELAPATLAPNATALSAGERRRLRATARAHGIALTGLHWLLTSPPGLHIAHPDPGVRARTLAHLDGLVGLAADLDAPVLVLGSPAQRSAVPPQAPAQATDLLIEGLSRLAPEAERAGVTLCIEPLSPVETDVITTAEQGIAVVTAIGSPAIRLILDVRAMSSEGAPLPALIARGAPYLAHFHANDANRGAPGSGNVDFRPILAALETVVYRGWISVEVFDVSAGAETIAHESLTYLRTCASHTGHGRHGTLPDTRHATDGPCQS